MFNDNNVTAAALDLVLSDELIQSVDDVENDKVDEVLRYNLVQI